MSIIIAKQPHTLVCSTAINEVNLYTDILLATKKSKLQTI